MNQMSSIPFSSGACCLPGVEGVTYIKIGPQQHTVGMMNLDMVFKQLFALGRRPDEVSDEEILGVARKFNFIPHKSTAEADHAEVLRQAYTIFYARQEEEDARAEQ
jgi:hypothetical protein